MCHVSSGATGEVTNIVMATDDHTLHAGDHYYQTVKIIIIYHFTSIKTECIH